MIQYWYYWCEIFLLTRQYLIYKFCYNKSYLFCTFDNVAFVLQISGFFLGTLLFAVLQKKLSNSEPENNLSLQYLCVIISEGAFTPVVPIIDSKSKLSGFTILVF